MKFQLRNIKLNDVTATSLTKKNKQKQNQSLEGVIKNKFSATALKQLKTFVQELILG